MNLIGALFEQLLDAADHEKDVQVVVRLVVDEHEGLELVERAEKCRRRGFRLELRLARDIRVRAI